MPLACWIQICLDFWDISIFLRYLTKSLLFSNSVFYSACALFKTMQIFSTSLAIKFDPDEIETFCFLLLKAEIHAILAQKL
jgi:hypothetical protein